MNALAKILIVDDQESIGVLLTTFFKKEGYEPYYAPNAQVALKLVEKTSFDLALVDIKIPGMDGIALLGELKKKLPEMPVIMITAYPSIDSAVKAMRKEAFDYVIKPFNLDELKQLVQRALEQKKTTFLSPNRLLWQYHYP